MTHGSTRCKYGTLGVEFLGRRQLQSVTNNCSRGQVGRAEGRSHSTPQERVLDSRGARPSCRAEPFRLLPEAVGKLLSSRISQSLGPLKCFQSVSLVAASPTHNELYSDLMFV